MRDRKVKLAYGKEGLEISLPSGNQTDVIEPAWVPGLEDPAAALSRALQHPVDHMPLKEFVRPGMRVGIIFSDITRATPYLEMLPPLLAELSHLPDDQIIFFCATGTHRLATDPELETILGSEVVRRFRIVQNRPTDPSTFTDLGKTASGNEVLVNTELLACDVKILTGFIEPHFFMGFSGGGKAVMPGMASLHTIRFNHSIRMLEDPRARWGITEGNPLWEDVHEAVGKLENLFLLNITLNKAKQITGVFAGDLHAAFRQGAAFAKKTAMVPVEKPYDLVITTNSGYPLDLNVYQSIKGLSAATQVVKQGGEILICSECWDGIPAGSDYEKMLNAAEDAETLYEFVKTNEQALQDTWQGFYHVLVLRKAGIHFYSDKLDEDTLRRCLFKPVKDPSATIREILDRMGPAARVCVLPEGPQTIPYLSSNH